MSKPLLLIDYDGTLAEIAARPGEAWPHPAVPDLLVRLSTRWPLYLITGRCVDDLYSVLGVAGIKVIGVHGLERGETGGEVRAELPPAARRGLEQLLPELYKREELRLEDKGGTLAIHYRDVADEAATKAWLRQLTRYLPPELEALWGKKVLELRPQGFGKGRVVLELSRQYPHFTPIYLGDDATDEDAFVALDAPAVTVKVGPGRSAARFHLANVEAVLAYLRNYLNDTTPG